MYLKNFRWKKAFPTILEIFVRKSRRGRKKQVLLFEKKTWNKILESRVCMYVCKCHVRAAPPLKAIQVPIGACHALHEGIFSRLVVESDRKTFIQLSQGQLRANANNMLHLSVLNAKRAWKRETIPPLHWCHEKPKLSAACSRAARW